MPEVRYVGVHQGAPMIVRMPDDSFERVFPGGTMTTTAKHADELCKTESWERVAADKKKGD